MPAENTSAARRFSDLEAARQPFLDRARECSQLTVPSLILPDGFNASSDLYTPYQSLGARGVNNLASRLLLTLLPPSSTFFRLSLSEKVNNQLDSDPQLKAAFDKGLSSIEQKVLKNLEVRATRVRAYEALRHLIVAGNVLIHLPKNGMRVFPISQYVCKRDCEGNVLEILIKEMVTPAALPEEIRDSIQAEMKPGEVEIPLYTHIRLGGPFDGTAPSKFWTNVKRWYVRQEVKGITVPGADGEYPLDKLPWLPLRWTRIDGEDYGRGHCEDYLGDLRSIEALEQAIVEASAAAARIIFLVNPNGTTDPEDLANAPNGAIRPGIKEEVGVVGVEKYNDLKVAKEEIDRLEQRLSYAFLLNTAIQRDGERVTAEEIRYMASELESSLGGVYSVMSIELQLPLVKLVMTQMQKSGEIDPLPDKTVEPVIVTGIDALGRSHELMKLTQGIQMAASILGPEVVSQRLNSGAILMKIFTGMGIDSDGMIRSDEEIQAEQQQAQNQQMVEKLGPHAIKAVSDNVIANAQMKQQAQAQPQATEA